MSMDELFAQMREFLSSPIKDDESRSRLFALLEQAYQEDKKTYKEIWLPYLQEHEEWWSEPLLWTMIRCMGGGMMCVDNDLAQRAESFAHYRELLPFAPFKCRLSGGKSYHEDEFELWDYNGLDGESAELCWGLSINRPHYSWDDGQYGNGWGTVRPDAILSAVSVEADELPNVRFFEVVEHKESEHESCGEYELSTRDTQRMSPRLGDGGLRSLRSIVSEFDLRELRLSIQRPLTQMAWLAEADCWPRLERLSLRDCGFGPGVIKTLFSKPMPSLKQLDLSYNDKFSDSGAKRLARSKSLEALEVLDLRGCSVTDEGEALLRGSERLPALHTILRDPEEESAE